MTAKNSKTNATAKVATIKTLTGVTKTVQLPLLEKATKLQTTNIAEDVATRFAPNLDKRGQQFERAVCTVTRDLKIGDKISMVIYPVEQVAGVNRPQHRVLLRQRVEAPAKA